jgi:cell wall-associated NlpC family hydrolase
MPDGLTAIASRMSEIQATISALSPTPVADLSAGSAFTARLQAARLAADSASAATTGLDGGSAPTSLDGLIGTTSGLGGTSASGPTGADVVTDARRYLGVPYKWGGTDPATGLDCSGLVQRVYGDLGIQLPRTVAEQNKLGTPVASMADARPGDLLAFGDHHIGIYVGDGTMLNAPHTGDVVRISNVWETPTQIRRILPEATSLTGSLTAGAVSDVRPTALRAGGSSGYDALFSAATQKYDLPAGLLKAVGRTESGLDAGARSPAGAIGLMQLMPGTARGLGVDPTDPAQAIDGAARLLAQNLSSFGSLPLAIAAYNAGAGAVRQYGGIPPYPETQTYVQRVLAAMPGSTT